MTIKKADLEARLGWVERRVDLAQSTAREANVVARQARQLAERASITANCTRDADALARLSVDFRGESGYSVYRENQILRERLDRAHRDVSELVAQQNRPIYYPVPPVVPAPPKRGPAFTWTGLSEQYQPGDVCFYEGKLYRFNNSYAGTTVAPHISPWWTELADKATQPSWAYAEGRREVKATAEAIVKEALDKLSKSL